MKEISEKKQRKNIINKSYEKWGGKKTNESFIIKKQT